MLEMFPDILTVKQLQNILSIGRSTVYSLLHSGKLKYITIGRQIRIPKKFLLDYLDDLSYIDNLKSGVGLGGEYIMTVSLQQKKGFFYAVFRVVDANGDSKQKWISTKIPVKRGNKREAQRVAEEIASKYEVSKVVAYPKTPFWQWIETWLEQKQNEVDRVTYQGYESYYRNHIGPYFKQHNVTLTDLSPQDIQQYYNRKMQKPGEQVKSKLSGKSLHHIVIRGALEDAVKKDIIPYNPADRVALPKKQKHIGSFYTREQTISLLEAIKGTVIENIVTLTIIYGLRRSEAVGLKWEAVNFQNDTFTIQSTVVRFSEIIEKDTTKNQASHRTYPMIPEVKQMFLSIRERQQSMKELMGDCYVGSGYVFTWDDGRILNPDYVTRKFSQVLKAHNLPHIRYHDLRHPNVKPKTQNFYPS